METIQTIYEFLSQRGWLHVDDPEEQISFLAAGEYNENYLVALQEIYGEAKYVFRINHGSQLGLQNQIEYEFTVLRALARSGVTPRPFYCDPASKSEGLGNGVLLMEFLPGRPLDYAADWEKAAHIFASTHSQPTGNQLITQANPVLDIARESKGLIERYPNHAMADKRDTLLRYHDEILALADEATDLFSDDSMVIANTEVNSHNFIIDEETENAWLVDWEKAVITSRFQDLSHFLVPTTTLWKTDFRFSKQHKHDFVKLYLKSTGVDMDLDTAMHMTAIMEQTILLRAMSWCFMAYHEYTQSERALKNVDTFGKITRYLEDMECFLTPPA